MININIKIIIIIIIMILIAHILKSVGNAKLVITLLSLLVAVPLSSSTISPVQLTRVTSLAFFMAARFSFNMYYVTTIGSGLSLYSGLFHVITVSLSKELFIFIPLPLRLQSQEQPPPNFINIK